LSDAKHRIETTVSIIRNSVPPAFRKTDFLVEREGGHIFFLNKKNGLLAGAEGAVAEGSYKSCSVAVATVERMCVNSTNLYFVDSNCIRVSLGYYVAVHSQGKAELIF
jgi:hypothetical protein